MSKRTQERGITIIVTLAGIVAGVLWIALAEGSSAGWLIWPTLAGAAIAGAMAITIVFAVASAKPTRFSAFMDAITGVALGANVVEATLAAMSGDNGRLIAHGLLFGALLVVVVSVLSPEKEEESK